MIPGTYLWIQYSLEYTIRRTPCKCFPKGKSMKYILSDLPKGSERTLARQPAWWNCRAAQPEPGVPHLHRRSYLEDAWKRSGLNRVFSRKDACDSKVTATVENNNVRWFYYLWGMVGVQCESSQRRAPEQWWTASWCCLAATVQKQRQMCIWATRSHRGADRSTGVDG